MMNMGKSWTCGNTGYPRFTWSSNI